MKGIRQLACLAVMTVIGFLSTSAPAHAAFKMTLDDGNPLDFKTITDNGIGDANTVTGAITFIGSVGIWTINVDTGISGGPSAAVMDLNTLNLKGSGTGTLTITLTDTGFTQVGASTLTNTFGGTIGPAIGSASVQSQAWLDPNNAEFGGGIGGPFTPGLLGPFNAPSGGGVSGFSTQASVADTTTSPYSMTLQIKITSTGNLIVSGDSTLTNSVVPELDPGSTASGLTLVSGSLLMLFGRRRRACA